MNEFIRALLEYAEPTARWCGVENCLHRNFEHALNNRCLVCKCQHFSARTDAEDLRTALRLVKEQSLHEKPFDVKATPRANRVIKLAAEEAKRLGAEYVGTEHLLLGIIKEGNGIGAGLLESWDITYDKAKTAVEFIVGKGS